MVKRNSLMMLAILIGVACVTDELHAKDGRGGGSGGGGMSRGGGSMSRGGGAGMRSSGMSRGASARSAGMSRGASARSAGVSRASIARSSAPRSSGRYVNRVSGRDLAAGRTATVTRTGRVGRDAALVGGGAAAGVAAARAGRAERISVADRRAGTDIAATTATTATTGRTDRTTAGTRTAAGRTTVPSNVRTATQNAQAVRGSRAEATQINRQANALRAPRGGNTTQQNRPQSFTAGGRRAHAFYRNGHRHIVHFRSGVPYLWSGGWWRPWPLFWNYWPWWYGFGGYYGRSYDECYDCDYYDCPDYCYDEYY